MLAKAGYEEASKTGDKTSMAVYRNLAGQTLQAVSGMQPDRVNLNAQPVATNETDPAPSQPLPQSSQAEGVSATALVMEYEGNEVGATQKYGGKRIRVTGTVNHVQVEDNGMVTLTFVSPAAYATKTQCFFTKSQSSRLAQLKSGDETTVEGIVRGLGGYGKFYVVMENCSVP
jgi:hypothetical protein